LKKSSNQINFDKKTSAELACEDAIILDKQRFGRVRICMMKHLRSEHGEEIANRVLSRINKRASNGSSEMKVSKNSNSLNLMIKCSLLNIKKQTRIAVFAVIMGMMLFVPAMAASYAAPSNENAIEHIPDRFIVVLKDDAKPDEFLKKHDVEKIKQYKHALKGFAVKGPPEKIDKIRNDPQVLFVEQDKVFHILAQNIPTGINRINAVLNTIANIDGVNDSLDVDIAIIDTVITSSYAAGLVYVASAAELPADTT